MTIRVKRVYDEPAKSDGQRVLVDRIWPRGLTKRRAEIDEWLRDIAPSTRLRKWFGHNPARWAEFKKRYAAELNDQPALIERLVREADKRRVTLLFGARDPEHNNAVALKDYIEKLR